MKSNHEAEKTLRAFASKRFGALQDVEDAIQDVWVVACESGRATPAKQVPWLKGVLNNLLKVRAKSRAFEAEKIRQLPDPVTQPSTDATVVKSEKARRVQAAIDSMPEHYREVVLLKYFWQMYPREIAEEIGVPVKVVRNRLARAHELLRSKLKEYRFGAFAVPAVLNFTKPSISASSGSMVVLQSLLAMKTKISFVVILASIVFAGLSIHSYIEGGDDLQELGAVQSEVEDVKRARRVERLRGATTTTPDSQPVEVVEFSNTQHGTAPAHSATPSLAGTLRFDVRDRASGERMEDISVRLANKDRFADLKRNAPVSLLLTAGTYSLLVSAPGYDPVEIHEVEIVAGDQAELDPVRLEVGTGTIRGRVIVPNHATAQAHSIELIGDGRVPCDACEVNDSKIGVEFCERCGFGRDSSRSLLAEDGTFEFHPLAGGAYFLSVRDQAGTVIKTHKLKLEARENRWLDLNVELIQLDIALFTTDETSDSPGSLNGERPFSGTWLEGPDAYYEDIQVYFSDTQAWVAGTTIPSVGAGISFTQLVPDEEKGDEEENTLRGREVTSANTGTKKVDRRRRPKQTLWPSFLNPAPVLKSKPLKASRIRHGVYRIEGIPAECKFIMITCGPWMTGTAPELIPQQETDGGPLKIVLSRCSQSSKTFIKIQREGGPGLECSSCHMDLPQIQLK